MMAPGSATSPREFGAALRAAREKSGVRLDVIAERTKIARRVLELLEAGEFAKLPNRVFVRLFLQQYLAIIGEAAADWTATFEATWQRFEDSSQPWEIAAPAPSRAARLLPWVIGLIVVVGGLVGVVLVERHHGGEDVAPTPPAHELPAPTAAPSAVPERVAPILPALPTPSPAPTSPPADVQALVVRAIARPCWVELRIDGERPQSRLLAAGSEWRLAAAGRLVTLVAGDGGALQVEYLGERRERIGTDGEVVRLRLGPAPATAGPTQ
jgi:hypothetical protein